MAKLPAGPIDAEYEAIDGETSDSGVVSAPIELSRARLEALATLDELPQANPVRVYLASLTSRRSRFTMADALKRIVRVMQWGDEPRLYQVYPWWGLRPEDTTEIRRRLIDGPPGGGGGFSVSTANLALSALRGVLGQCFRLGYLSGEQHDRLAAFKGIRGDGSARGRHLLPEQVVELRRACAEGGAFESALNTALLELGLAAGLRREELARLRVGDLTIHDRTLASGEAARLVVHGKGRKVREAALSALTAGALEAWLAQRDRFPFTTDSLFVHAVNGRAQDHGMSGWQVWDRLRDVSRRAGVAFTPHDMRRTCIGMLIPETDIASVAKIVGHSDPRTTMRYDKRPEDERVRALVAVGRKLGQVGA